MVDQEVNPLALPARLTFCLRRRIKTWHFEERGAATNSCRKREMMSCVCVPPTPRVHVSAGGWSVPVASCGSDPTNIDGVPGKNGERPPADQER